MARSSVVLPAPLRPIRANALAGLDGEGEAVKDDALAVARDHIRDDEAGRGARLRHWRCRDRPVGREDRPGPRRTLPEATMRPITITETGQSSASTKVMSCSIRSTAAPVSPRIASISSTVRDFSARVMPAAGSSSRMSRGSVATTMASSSHCFWPCESAPARKSRPWPRPTAAMVAVARARPSRLRPRAVAATRRFCAMVSEAKTDGTWNLRTRPAAATSWRSSPARSRPRKRTTPAVGAR